MSPTLALLCAAALGSFQEAADRPERPNFVFLLVDDLGYMDVGANNPETFYETPNVDRLAAGGMRFTHGYAASPVCSPTRYSIMTGRYPVRAGVTDYFTGRRAERFAPAPLENAMPLEEVTLAEAMGAAGYRTAFLGKWHLGPTEEFWPERQGFDVNVGGWAAGMPRSYFSPYSNPRLQDGTAGEHLTARLTDEAVALIERFQDDPFLIFLSYYTVHTPLQAPEERIDRYRDKEARLGEVADEERFAEEEQVWPRDRPRRVRIRQDHATYAAMVESMDAGVGRILDALEALELERETVVCFFSDNGGLSTAEGSPTSNVPLRGGKGWLYEGGIRVPCIVKWPGKAAAGSVSNEPVISTDFYPTLLEMAGLAPRPEQHLDGRSLVPELTGEVRAGPRDLFWHYPHYANQGGFPGGAIRRGRWKLVQRYEDGRIHLFDLARDPGEREDRAAAQPELTGALRQSLHAWYAEHGASFLSAREGGPEPWRPE